MNKLLEKLDVPGSETYRLVVPRSEVEKKDAYYQMELFDIQEER